MISRPLFDAATTELLEIEHSLHRVRWDWSSPKIVRSYLNIALYNISNILAFYSPVVSPSDRTSLAHLASRIKYYKRHALFPSCRDGRFFNEPFPDGYNFLYDPSWLPPPEDLLDTPPASYPPDYFFSTSDPASPPGNLQ